MSILTDAIEAAEARKTAVLGEATEPAYQIADDFQRAAILGGFDLNMDELNEVAARAGLYFAQFIAGSDIPLKQNCSLTWMDGFLVGLMVTQVAKEPYESND